MNERRTDPDWIVFSAWQGNDDDHPPGSGEPAYRVVYKTLRLLLPQGRIQWPDLRCRMGHGTVSRGGVRLPGALPARQPGKWVLPEFGKLVPSGDQFKYEPTGVRNFEFDCWEDEIEDVVFVEFLLKTTSTKPSEQLIEGRERLAELKTMIDLRFGPRVLGALLAEEAGEVFADWHFNRRLNSDNVGHEFQLDVTAVTAEESCWSGRTAIWPGIWAGRSKRSAASGSGHSGTGLRFTSPIL